MRAIVLVHIPQLDHSENFFGGCNASPYFASCILEKRHVACHCGGFDDLCLGSLPVDRRADRRRHFKDFIDAYTPPKSGLQAIFAAMALLKYEVLVIPLQLLQGEVSRSIGPTAPVASAPGQSLGDNGSDRGSDNRGIDPKVEEA
jgi:hypothetical protein